MVSGRATAALLVLALGTASPVGFWAPLEPDCDCRCSDKVGCPMCRGHHHAAGGGDAKTDCSCAIRGTDAPSSATTGEVGLPDPALPVTTLRPVRRARGRAADGALLQAVWRTTRPPRPPPRAVA